MIQLIAASFLWSLSFALIGQSGIDPDLLAAARLGLAAALFAPFLLVRRRGGDADAGARDTAITPARALALAGIGALQFGAMYVLVFRAYGYLQGHEVALLTITTPVFVVLLGSLVEGRCPWRPWLGAAVAMGAAYALRGNGLPDPGGAGHRSPADFWMGVALVQGANALFALGQLLYRRLETGARHPERAFALLYLGGFAVTAPWALAVVPAAALELGGRQLAIIAYLGCVPSGLAFYLWNRGATRVDVGTLAVMNNLKIPLAVLVALCPPFLEPANPARLALSAALLALALAVALSGPPAPRPAARA